MLKQLICIKIAGRANEVEHKIRHLELVLRRCEGMAGVASPEDLKIKQMIDVRARELRDNSELNTMRWTTKALARVSLISWSVIERLPCLRSRGRRWTRYTDPFWESDGGDVDH